MSFEFDIETISEQISDGHWQLQLTPYWNIGNNPNGGYLLACLLRAMTQLVTDTPDPVAVTTHYLRPGLPGVAANLKVNIVRIGRRTATLAGTLEQENKPRITCTATFGKLESPEAGSCVESERLITLAPPDLPPPDECTSRLELAQAVDLPIMERLDIRVDPRYARSVGHKEAVMSGWVRFRDERPADSLALALFCDAFPPSVFTLYGQIGWVPTLELSVHIRRKPTSDWIKGTFATDDLTGNLFIEDGALWDESNQLVARSRQLQMILT